MLFFNNEKEKSDFILKNGSALSGFISFHVTTPEASDLFKKSVSKPLAYLMPIVAYINMKSEITYLSEGYRIGTGDDLLRFILEDEKSL